MSRPLIWARRWTTSPYGLALLLIFGIALFIRTYFPYDSVFAGDWVRFQINDPWFYMRHIENLAHHFPYPMPFDPYVVYPLDINPDRIGVGISPFFELLVGFFIWVFGAGSQSQQTIDTMGAYFPAVLGAFVTIPVFFIGKELFSGKAGLLAAALIAILPGQFLLRSLLGFTDHHVAEVLFSTLAMLFLILAMKSSKQKELSFASLRSRDWRVMRKPLLHSGLSGIALGCYLLSWIGGGLFIFVIFASVIVQYLVDHLRGRGTDYLCITGVFTLFIALLVIVPSLGQYDVAGLQAASLAIGILAFLVMGGLSHVMARRGTRRVYYPLAVVVLGGIGLGVFRVIDPSLLTSILDKLEVVKPTGGILTISEAQPLFSSGNISQVWQLFTTSFYLALVSLVMVAYLVVRKGEADKTLLLVWSVVILIATLGQNRFSYYFAVNVAILTAYLSWRVLELGGFGQATAKVDGDADDDGVGLEAKRDGSRNSREARRRKRKGWKGEAGRDAKEHATWRHAWGMIAIVVVFFLAFYPNIGGAVDWASYERGATDDWHDALAWMKENTPEPFDDPDFYYEQYEKPPAGEWYHSPESAYGVMSWWDYGYWITRIAHRIPSANPGGGKNKGGAAGSFMVAQDESSASEILDRLGSRYVIIDDQMATGQTVKSGRGIATINWKFYAMVVFAGGKQSDYYDLYFQKGQPAPTRLYYPEYYRSMSSRLYNFGGKEWDPFDDWIRGSWDDEMEDYREKILAVAYEVRRDANGTEYKEITSVQGFSEYDTAREWVEANPDHRIVGTSPLLSPVPLDELERYKLVYKSPSIMGERGGETISRVEIFEYLPQR